MLNLKRFDITNNNESMITHASHSNESGYRSLSDRV